MGVFETRPRTRGGMFQVVATAGCAPPGWETPGCHSCWVSLCGPQGGKLQGAAAAGCRYVGPRVGNSRVSQLLGVTMWAPGVGNSRVLQGPGMGDRSTIMKFYGYSLGSR